MNNRSFFCVTKFPTYQSINLKKLNVQEIFKYQMKILRQNKYSISDCQKIHNYKFFCQKCQIFFIILQDKSVLAVLPLKCLDFAHQEAHAFLPGLSDYIFQDLFNGLVFLMINEIFFCVNFVIYTSPLLIACFVINFVSSLQDVRI